MPMIPLNKELALCICKRRGACAYVESPNEVQTSRVVCTSCYALIWDEVIAKVFTFEVLQVVYKEELAISATK